MMAKTPATGRKWKSDIAQSASKVFELGGMILAILALSANFFLSYCHAALHQGECLT